MLKALLVEQKKVWSESTITCSLIRMHFGFDKLYQGFFPENLAKRCLPVNLERSTIENGRFSRITFVDKIHGWQICS